MDSNSHSPDIDSRPVDSDAEEANAESGSVSLNTGLWAAISVGVSLVMGVIGNFADVSAVLDKFRQGGLAALAQIIVTCAIVAAIAAAISIATHRKIFTKVRLRKAMPVVLSGCAGLLIGHFVGNIGIQQPRPDLNSSPTAATSAPNPAPPSYVPLRSISIPEGREVELTLHAGEADFDAPSRWRLRADAVTTGRCTFRLFGPSGSQRFVDGASPLVHGRLKGSHQLRSAENCRIFVQGSDEQFDYLPYSSKKTTQSGASPIFEVDGDFTVRMGPGRNCGASLFRDDGGKEGQSVGADSIRSFRGPGRFWVETETYNCQLEINEN